MLVSSIGYLKAVHNVHNDNVVKSQNVKSSALNEGFGHFDTKQVNDTIDTTFVRSLVNNFKSLFSKDKADESVKYLSLIA